MKLPSYGEFIHKSRPTTGTLLCVCGNVVAMPVEANGWGSVCGECGMKWGIPAGNVWTCNREEEINTGPMSTAQIDLRLSFVGFGPSRTTKHAP